MLRAISLVTRPLALLGVWLAVAAVLHANTLTVPGQYTTIQAAINAANTGDTVQVAAGTYAENLIIGKSIHLIGPNVGINAVSGTRVGEAVIVPATVDTQLGTVIRFFNGTDGTVSNVTIDGLTINGINPKLGSSISAALGIGDLPQSYTFPTTPMNDDDGTSLGWETSLANITIQNNIICNLVYHGIGLLTENADSEGNTIANNKIYNLQWIAAPDDTLCWDGVGIFLRGGVYANVTGNSITQAQTGIIFSMDYTSTGDFNPSITNNYIECIRGGIFTDLTWGSFAPFTIENNTIVGKPHPTAGIIAGGLMVISCNGVYDAPIENNTVSDCAYGLFIYNSGGGGADAPVTFTNNTFTNNTYGVYVTNYTPWWSTASSSDINANILVNGGAITGCAGAGIYMFDAGFSACAANLTLQGGIPISDGVGGVVIQGAQNTLNFAGSQAAAAALFSGQSGDYFTLAASLYPDSSNPIVRVWQNSTTQYVISDSDVMVNTLSGTTWNNIHDYEYEGATFSITPSTATVTLPAGTVLAFSVGGNGDLFLATNGGTAADTGCTAQALPPVTYPGDVMAQYAAIDGSMGFQMTPAALLAAENNIIDAQTNRNLGRVWLTDPVVQAVNTVETAGESVTVPITLLPLDKESSISFSLDYTPTVLSNPTVKLGGYMVNYTNATLSTNVTQTSSGKIGITITLPAGTTFITGETQQIATVTFTVAKASSFTTTNISFGDSPVVRQMSDGSTPTWQTGTVTISVGYEGDVTPRPNGKDNGTVTVTDWVEEGRFVAGLDTPAPGSEFQRADCSPASTLGDGKLTIADWVQVGRYAAGLDPVVPAGGPTTQVSTVGVTSPALTRVAATLKEKTATLRELTLSHGTLAVGEKGTVIVSLNALGDENALGFSVQFDADVLQFVSAKLVNGNGSEALMVNSLKAANGQLGLAFALPAGKTFNKGLQGVVELTFLGRKRAPSGTPLTFNDQQLAREIDTVKATALPMNYVDGTLLVVASPLR